MKHSPAQNRLTAWLTLLLLSGLGLLTASCERPPAPPPQASAENFTLRFGHDMPEGNPHHLAAEHFARLVEERSAGRLKIEIYPAHKLGTDHEMVAMAQNGALDIILPPTAKLSGLEPAFQVVDLPFLFHNHEEAHRILDGPTGLALLKKLQPLGLTGVAFWDSGFKQLTVDRKIRSERDLQGLKFRIMRSGVLRDQFQSWGVETIAIEFSKTHQALAEGIVNGHENPLNTIYHMKFHEVQRHLILSNHGYIAQALLISNKTLERLPAKLQEILINSGRETRFFQREEATRHEKKILEEIKKSAITLHTLNNQTINRLKKRSRIVMEKHRMSIGTEIIETALQGLSEQRHINNDNLVIALDADMIGNSAISGLAIRRGIEIAIHEINAKGGVLGKKLRLIARDNSMVSARGIDNLQRFSKISNLVAVFGGISSPVVISELELIHKNKILFLDPWAAATQIIDNKYKPNYVFRVSVRDEHAAQFLLKKALGTSKKIALLLVNNDWGRSNHASIKKELKKLGQQPVSEQWFDWGDSHLEAKIDEIAAAGAGVILYVGNVVEAAKMVRHLDNRNLQIPVFSHWGIAGGDMPKLAGASLDKVKIEVLQTFSFINNNRPITKRVTKLYRQLYGIDDIRKIPAQVGTAHAYELTHLLARAIQKAGKTDMPSIRTAMENLGQHDGLLRTYQSVFTPERHDALTHEDYFLAHYQQGVLMPVK